MAMRCYFCGREQGPKAPGFCLSCGRPLTATPASELFGRRYILNRLDDLARGGVLDADSAERVRRAMLRELGEAPTPEPAAPVVPSPVDAVPAVESRPVPSVRPAVTAAVRERPAGPSPIESLFTPERAPSLLLYLGAFLVVVAALIFVNVSREQVSDAVRLALMIVGTLGFLGAGLLCHRVPRVEEAGRTFIVIGALLVPVDFAAYYVLVAHESPLTSPVMWIVGSLWSAGLYGGLATNRYGTAYAYLFFAACLSAIAGILAWSDTVAWAGVLFAGLALAIQLVDDRAGRTALAHLTRPLLLPARVLVAVALVVGSSIALAVGLGVPAGGDRFALSALGVVGLAYYVVRARLEIGWERWLAVAGPAAVAEALVFAFGAPLQTYGFAAGILAVCYALAGELGDLAGQPTPLAGWVRIRAVPIAYVAVGVALVPFAAYWRAPAVGALVYLGMTALLAVLVARRARSARAAQAYQGATLVAAAVAHVGVVFALVAAGVLHAGPAPMSGLVFRELALAFSPLAAGLAVLAALARRRLAPISRPLAIAAVSSAVLVVDYVLADPPLATILAALAAAVIVASGVDARRPAALWLAAAFAAVAASSAVRWLDPPEATRPVAAALAALVIFVPAYLPRFRADPFARVAREIAVSLAGVGVLSGLAFAFARSFGAASLLPWDTGVWWATVPVVSAFGAIAVAEALHRRSPSLVLAATLSFLGSTLMIVASLHPAAVEAYTLPVALYFAIVAWALSRFGPAELRSTLATPAQIAAALALIAPTYLWSWRSDEPARTVLVLAEGLLLLGGAANRGSAPLSVVSLGALAAAGVRATAAPLAFESVAGIAGVATIALTLFVPGRIAWRVDPRLREAAEAMGVLLLLAPPLVRATAFGSDALMQGGSVLAGGTVIVALALWSGRRALFAAAATMLGCTTLVSLNRTEMTEPYVAAAGVAIVALALAIPRYLPRRLAVELEWALEILGAAMIVASPLVRAFGAAGAVPAARALAEGMALLAIGLLVRRRALPGAGFAAVVIVAAWILGDPSARQFHAIAAGAALVALSLAAVRYRADLLDERALIGAEWLGAFLFVGPTLLASWSTDFFPATPIVFFEIALILGTGILLRRRWLVVGALAALGLEALRGTIDVVNRLPNWALFGVSGVILLAAGFVLLLKREAWNQWSHRAYGWWARL